MKVSEFLRKLDPVSTGDVHLVVTHTPSIANVFLFDRDHLRRLWKIRGWSKQYPFNAYVLRIYLREGAVSLTARFNDEKEGE